MKKVLQCFLLLLFLIASQAYAQNRTVTGTITDKKDGQTLPGVSVIVKGTQIGTQTDANGKFSINVPNSQQAITVTYIGYVTQDVPVTGSSLSISMAAAQTQLSEVVVVGYGTQERKDVTGVIGSVSGNEISNLATPSFDAQLAGRVTGVNVTVNSGVLGAAPTIRIRGTNSLSQGASPLYVVDGVPIITGNQSSVTPTNPLADINPNDIESIDVLKDGSATAIYGSRASNGVILITTKRGKLGTPRVNYDMWLGYSQVAKQLKVLNADQFIQISNEKFANSGVTSPVAFQTLDANGKPISTNWQDVIFRTGFQQNHSLSVSAANENTNYFFSGAYTNQEGAIDKNALTRYSFRAKVEQKALKILTIGFNSSLGYVKTDGLNTGANNLSGNVQNALLAFPNVPVFNADGSYDISADGTRLGRGANLREIDNNYTNIKYVLDHNVFTNQNLTVNGTAFLDAKIINGLNLRTQIGINNRYGEDYQYYDPYHGDGRGSNGIVENQYLPESNYVWTNTLNFNRTFGDHKISAVVGAEYQETKFRSFYAEGTGLSNTYFGATNGNNNIISNSYATQLSGGDNTQNSLKSYFSRISYSFKDRYLLTVSYRRDALSKLAAGHQWAGLPGASVGWRVSDEGFFKNTAALNFISDFKVRAGYAKVGNTSLNSNYPFANTFAPVQYGSQSGLGYSNQGNPDLSFETNKKINAGFDLGFLKNRITLTADYYKNKNDNLILSAPVAGSLGIPGNAIAKNVGSTENKGFEFGINSVNITKKDFSWSTEFNLTLAKSKILSLNQNQDIIYTYNIQRVGQTIGAFYGYQSAGVNPANGNPLYVKGNGQVIQGNIANNTYYNYDPANPTALTTTNTLSSTADKKILGNSLPTYYGGFGNTVTYKSFDLNIFFTYSGGNKVYNATKQEVLMNMAFNNNGTDILNRWTTPGQITDVPKIVYGQGNFINNSGNATSRFLEDGKFIRAQNISLGYTLPTAISSKLKMNRVRIFAAVQNAFVITKYSGVDPEANNTATAGYSGIDYSTNPTTRTYTMGLNVGF